MNKVAVFGGSNIDHIAKSNKRLNRHDSNIGKISSVAISPTINEYANNTTLNEILEDPDYSVDDALQELQDAVDAEQN